jgi:archaeosine synthase beta-subunit
MLTVEASRSVRTFLRHIRENQPKSDDGDVRWALVAGFGGEETKRGIIGIPTRGCSYARTEWGGCSVCGHVASSLWNSDITIAASLEDVESSLRAIDQFHTPHVCLYTSGSFLDPEELPSSARQNIIELIRQRPWIKEISVESIPRFVTEDAITRLRNAAPDLLINVGIGLDSSDEFIRRTCFQRHMPTREYRRAVSVCLKLEVSTTAYVVYGNPLLSICESIHDTSDSIIDALEWGFTKVSIEPVALQVGTLQQALWKEGRYDPPTFWGIVSVLRSVRARMNVEKSIVIGGQVFTPIPQHTIRVCPSCRDAAKQEMPELGYLFDTIPTCENHAECGRPQQGMRLNKPETLDRIERLLATRA